MNLKNEAFSLWALLALNPYSNTLLVQTTVCADQYETVVDLIRLCEDRSSVKTQRQCEKLWNQDDPTTSIKHSTSRMILTNVWSCLAGYEFKLLHAFNYQGDERSPGLHVLVFISMTSLYCLHRVHYLRQPNCVWQHRASISALACRALPIARNLQIQSRSALAGRGTCNMSKKVKLPLFFSVLEL